MSLNSIKYITNNYNSMKLSFKKVTFQRYYSMNNNNFNKFNKFNSPLIKRFNSNTTVAAATPTLSLNNNIAPMNIPQTIAANSDIVPVLETTYFGYFHDLLNIMQEVLPGSWVTSIIAITVILRLSILPVYVMNQRNTARLAPMQELSKKIMSTMSTGPQAMVEGQAKLAALYKEHKVDPMFGLKAIGIQSPFLLTLFFGINSLQISYPEILNLSFGWLTSLAVPDPMYILPASVAACQSLAIEMGADGLQKSAMGKYLNLFRLVPIIGFLVMMNMKAGVVLYFLVSTTITLAFTRLCKVESFRKRYNFPNLLPPVIKSTDGTPLVAKPVPNPDEMYGYNKQKFVGNLKSHNEFKKNKNNNAVKKL